jgi:copper chaperone CopZ
MKSLCMSAAALALLVGFGIQAAEMTPEEKRAAALKAAGLSPKPAAAKAEPGKPMTGGSGSGIETVEFPVTGMMCNNCVAQVQDSFMKADGVTAAKPDMAGNKTMVTYDKSKTNLDQILATFMAKKARRFDAAKPGEKIKGPVYTYNGSEETLTGALAVKAKDAPADVLCRIVARRNGEEGERAFNVIVADPAIRAKIEELRNKGDKPALVGVVSEAGITVTKLQ